MPLPKNNRLVFVIATLKQGGAERVMSELVNFCSKQNYDVHLITWALADDFYTISNNVTIHRLGFSHNNKLQKSFSVVVTVWRLRRLLVTLRPKAVTSFMIKSNIVSLLASLFLG